MHEIPNGEAEEEAFHGVPLCRSSTPWETRPRTALSSWVGGKDSLLLEDGWVGGKDWLVLAVLVVVRTSIIPRTKGLCYPTKKRQRERYCDLPLLCV